MVLLVVLRSKDHTASSLLQYLHQIYIAGIYSWEDSTGVPYLRSAATQSVVLVADRVQ